MSVPGDERSGAPIQTQTLSGAQTTEPTGNVMRGSEGRTARLTVISVLLGATVAAIVVALPPTPSVFARSFLTDDHLIIDLQVLAMLLFVFDFWITFSWSTILGIAPFDFVSNLMLFLLGVLAIGWALSMSEVRAWLGWYVALDVVGLINLLISRFIRHALVSWWRLVVFVAFVLALTYAAGNAYGAWCLLGLPPRCHRCCGLQWPW